MSDKIINGRDFNFYKKVSVTNTDFQDTYDCIITFPTQSVMFLNENTVANGNVVEYSFNGNIVHGELDTTLPSRGMVFDSRPISKIWFRVKNGSSGPIIIRIDAWSFGR